MNPTYNFEGQVALVTGPCSGIGLATARQFARSGAAVVLADVNEAQLSARTKELTDAGYRVDGGCIAQQPSAPRASPVFGSGRRSCRSFSFVLACRKREKDGYAPCQVY
jgi:NAD(P)-dependent dehydrogenase (short-subunit alcohol dehydrogenase family)